MVSLARLIYALAISEAPLAISISCEGLNRLINSINKSDRDSITILILMRCNTSLLIFTWPVLVIQSMDESIGKERTTK